MHTAPHWPSSVQFSCSVVSDSLRPHESQHARPPCPLPTPGVHPDSCLSSQWCHPAISSSVIPFSSCPQSLPASVFSNESTLRMRWPKYWSFSFSSIPSKEHPGLIFFRMAWLDLLAVQGTLKGLLQHHSSKASILQHSAFFIIQLSHPYNGNPLQYSCLENPRDGGAWWAAISGVAQSQTWLKRLSSSSSSRPPCPSPTPGIHSDSRPSSQWCHPAISSSGVPFSSCPQSLPASVFSNESTLHMRWPKC